MSHTLAIRITEETLPIITFLNDGVRPDDSTLGDFFLNPRNGHNDIISSQALVEKYPTTRTFEDYQVL